MKRTRLTILWVDSHLQSVQARQKCNFHHYDCGLCININESKDLFKLPDHSRLNEDDLEPRLWNYCLETVTMNLI